VVRGAVLLGQDGTYVSFRKKCMQCGFEDNCRSNLLIVQGAMRALFYCTKCKKSRDVQLLGMLQ
jgi:hypothetical protein